MTLPYFTFLMRSPVKDFSMLRHYEIDPVHIPDVTKITETSEKLLQTEVGLMVIIIIYLFIIEVVTCNFNNLIYNHSTQQWLCKT